MALNPEQAKALFTDVPKAQATLTPEDAESLFKDVPKQQATLTEDQARAMFEKVPYKQLSLEEHIAGRGASVMAGATGVLSGALDAVANPFRDIIQLLRSSEPAPKGQVSPGGGSAPGGTMSFPYDGQTLEIKRAGFPTDQAAFEAFMAGQNQPTNFNGAGDTPFGEGALDVQFNPDGSMVGAPTQPKPGRKEDIDVNILGFDVTGKSKELREKSKDYREISQMYIPGSPWGKFGTQAIDALTFMGPSVATSYITKKPNFSLAVMGTQVFTDTYAQSRNEGKGIDESIEDAMIMTLTEILPEKAFGIFDNIQVGKSIKRYIATAITEGFSESGTGGLQVWDETVRQGKPLPPIKEILKRLGYEGLLGTAIGGGMTAPGYVGSLFGETAPPTLDPLKIGAITPQGPITPLPKDAFNIFGAPKIQQGPQPKPAPASIIGQSPVVQAALSRPPQTPAKPPTPAVEPTPAVPEPTPEPEPQTQPAKAKAYKQGNKVQAFQMPDGTWRVRTRPLVRAPWSDWETVEEFDPSPVFGFTELTSPSGTIRIKGEGTFPIGKDDTGKVEGPKPPRDLLEQLARGQGLNRAAWQKEGVDPAEFGRKFGIHYLFRKEGGLTPDKVREFMQEGGEFLPEDTDEGGPSQVYDNDAVEKVMSALGGERIISETDAPAEWEYQVFLRAEEERAEMEEFAKEIGERHGITFRPEDYLKVVEYYENLSSMIEENATQEEFDEAVEAYLLGIVEEPTPAAGEPAVAAQAGTESAGIEKTEAGDQNILNIPKPTGEETTKAAVAGADETRAAQAAAAPPPEAGAGELFAGTTPGERPVQTTLIPGEEGTPGIGPATTGPQTPADEHIAKVEREDPDGMYFNFASLVGKATAPKAQHEKLTEALPKAEAALEKEKQTFNETPDRSQIHQAHLAHAYQKVRTIEREINNLEQNGKVSEAAQVEIWHDQSYSADRIGESSKIRKPFEMDGKRWISTGGGQGSYHFVEVIPAEEYKGEVTTYGNRDRRGYTGIAVTYRGKDFVLGEEIESKDGKFSPRERPEPAKARTTEGIELYGEELNPKVEAAVNALNDAGIETDMSGDLYGDDLVYIDLAEPPNITSEDLPKGWVLVQTDVALTNAALTGKPPVHNNGEKMSPERVENLVKHVPLKRIARLGAQAISEADTKAIIATLKGERVGGYPQPNEGGIYDRDQGESHELFDKTTNSEAHIWYMETAKGEWRSSYSYDINGERSKKSEFIATDSEVFATKEDAIDTAARAIWIKASRMQPKTGAKSVKDFAAQFVQTDEFTRKTEPPTRPKPKTKLTKIQDAGLDHALTLPQPFTLGQFTEGRVDTPQGHFTINTLNQLVDKGVLEPVGEPEPNGSFNEFKVVQEGVKPAAKPEPKPKAEPKDYRKTIDKLQSLEHDLRQNISKATSGFNDIKYAADFVMVAIGRIKKGSKKDISEAAEDLVIAEGYAKGFKNAAIVRKHLLQVAKELDPTLPQFKEEEKLTDKVERQTRGGSPEFNRLSSTLRPSLFLDIWSDNGINAERAVNWPLKRQIKKAIKITKDKFGFFDISLSPDMKLNEAMDQLQDAYRNMQGMVHVFGLPATAIGLNKTLRLTLEKRAPYLGAYSPGGKEISIPGRSNSFAHEWGHALDYFLLDRVQKLTESFEGLSGRVRSDGVEPAPQTVEEAFVSLMDNLFFEQSILAADIMGWELQAVNGTARQQTQAKQKLKEAREGKLKTRKNRSKYFRSAKEYGNPRYWNKPTEMLARAFEAYTAHKSEEAGFSNEFITKADANYLDESEDRLKRTFPKLHERARIFAAFDRLFEQIAGIDMFNGPAHEHPGEANVVDPRDYDIPLAEDKLVDHKAIMTIGKDLRRSYDNVQATLKDKPKHPEHWLRRADRWRSMGADAIRARARALEFMYPQSKALKTFFDKLVIAPGEGAEVAEDIKIPFIGKVIAQKSKGRTNLKTVHEETVQRYFNTMRRFDGILRKHGLTDMNNAENLVLRNLLLGNDVTAPDSMVKAAAAIRMILKDTYYDFKAAGIDMGVVTDKGYLTRTYQHERVLESEESKFKFLRDAIDLFENHQFPHEFGLDDFTRDQYAEEVVSDPRKMANFIRNVRFYSGANERVANALGKLRAEIKKLKKAAAKESEETGEEVKVDEEELEALYREFVEETWSDVANDYARARSMHWFNAIATPNVEDYFQHVAQPGAPILKGRQLVGAADDIMADWLDTDVANIIDKYARSASRKIAHVNHFGANNEILDGLIEQMQNEGVHRIHIERALALGATVEGHIKHGLPEEAQSMADWTHTFGYISLLGLAVASSLAESGSYAIRTGNLKHAFSALIMAVQGITKSEKARDLREMAYIMNIIGHRATSAVLQNQLGGQYTMSPRAGRLMQMFFDATLLTKLTEAQRAYGVGVAYEFLRKQSQNWIGNKNRKDAEAQFRELGINNFEEFSTWLLESNEMPRPDELYESDGRASPRGDQYMLATQRMVDQSIQNPDISLRPQLASNPLGRLMYGIMAFAYSFYENLVKRELKLLIRKDNPDAFKYFVTHTFPAFAALGIAQILVSTARELLLNGDRYDDMDDEERVKKLFLLGVNRAYGYGGIDPMLQYAYGLKYDKSLAEQAAGAAPGLILQNIDKVAGFFSPRNVEGTTTAEYRAAEGAYTLALVPSLNAAFSATGTIPGLRIPSAVGIYMSKTFREEFASMFGSRPDFRDEVDKKYSAVKGEVNQKLAEISDRLRELPKGQWQKEFDKAKQEDPELLEGITLKMYKTISKSGKIVRQNILKGRAGLPIDKEGKPQYDKPDILKDDERVTAANKAMTMLVGERGATYGRLFDIEEGLSPTLDKARTTRKPTAKASASFVSDVREEVEDRRREIKRELTKELRRRAKG